MIGFLAHVPWIEPFSREWLKSGYMENTGLNETTDGDPTQAGIISPALPIARLDGLERL